MLPYTMDRKLVVLGLFEALRLHVLSVLDVSTSSQSKDTFEKLFDRLQVVVDQVLTESV